jgi:hypothetical protein
MYNYTILQGIMLTSNVKKDVKVKVMRRRKCPPCDGITGKLICKNIDRYLKCFYKIKMRSAEK